MCMFKQDGVYNLYDQDDQQQMPPASNLDTLGYYDYPESSLHEINSPIQEETDSGPSH